MSPRQFPPIMQWSLPVHRTTTRLVALSILLFSFLAAAPADGRMANDQLDPSTLGMRPNGGFLRLPQLADQEAKLGQPVRWHVAMAGKQSPASMRSAMFGQLRSATAVLPGLADQLDLVATVPLAFGKVGSEAENRRKLVETASGKWDRDFEAVAKSLVIGGYPDAVIRLGHEMTGYWYPWSSRGNSSQYVAAYRRVHKVFSRVSADFRFEWNTARPKFNAYGPAAYPGNDVVDIIGMDVYNRPMFRTEPLSDTEWDRQFERYLVAHRDFAVSHGKPVAYSEWANGSIDDPKFIRLMHDWMVSLPASGPGRLLYQSYFTAGNDTFNLDLYPETAATFYALFGATNSTAGGGGPDPDPPPPVATPSPTPAPTATPMPTATPTTPPSSSVTVSIRAASAKEGNSGQKSQGFRIKLSNPVGHDVTVTFATKVGTAKRKKDFKPRRDVEVVIPAGKTKVWVGVNIVGDRKREPTEHFFVTISDPQGAKLGKSRARATILDND